MTNIPLNGVVFPSPSVARQIQQHNISSPVFSAPGQSNYNSYTQSTSSVAGIQFPSPYYTRSPISDPTRQYTSSGHSTMPSASDYYISPLIMSSRCSSNGAGLSPVPCTSSWQQNVPSSFTWAMPGAASNLVQFTASTVTAVSNSIRQYAGRSPSSLSSLSRQQVNLGRSTERKSPRKRKSSTFDELAAGKNSKVFIHEDKIAAGMQGLHLQPPQVGQPQSNFVLGDKGAWYVEAPTISDEDSMGEEDPETGEMDGDMSTEPKLRFSQELKMGLKNKDLVPQLIMDEINKSQMQIVLWKPPGDHVTKIVNGFQQGNGGKLDMDKKPEFVSPNIWSIPAGQCNEDLSSSPPTETLSSHQKDTMNPVNTKSEIESSNINMNPCGNNGLSNSNSDFNTQRNITSSGTGKSSSSSSSVKFDFNFGPSLWNETCHLNTNGKGTDFIACSTPKCSTDGNSGFNNLNNFGNGMDFFKQTSLKSGESQACGNLNVFDCIDDDDMDL